MTGEMILRMVRISLLDCHRPPVWRNGRNNHPITGFEVRYFFRNSNHFRNAFMPHNQVWNFRSFSAVNRMDIRRTRRNSQRFQNCAVGLFQSRFRSFNPFKFPRTRMGKRSHPATPLNSSIFRIPASKSVFIVHPIAFCIF